METIELKTKIKKLEIGCRKQHIEFKAFDMTSRMVSNVDKLIRNNDTEYVKMTIGPENEKLDIEPIVSVVKLVAMECAGKGQHIKIAGFRTSGNKFDIINNYINCESDVSVTFEQTQEKMIDETPEETVDRVQGIGDNDSDLLVCYEGNSSTGLGQASDGPKDIELKLPPKWGVKVYIKFDKFEVGKIEYWQYGFVVKIGNIEKAGSFDECGHYEKLNDCTYNLKQELESFIDAQENFKQAKPLKKKIEKALEDFKFENE